jgi:acyl-CoA synthetase (AMP-forming)/AMP-acid ligase II
VTASFAPPLRGDDEPEALRGHPLSRVMVGEWLDMTAVRTPDLRCYVVEDGSSRTFAEVCERVHALVRSLVHHGVRQGDRVAILSTDCPEYVEVCLAFLKMGVTAVPLNFRLAAGEVETLMRTARASWAFVSSRYAELMVSIQPRLPDLQCIVKFDGDADLPTFDDLLASDPGGPTPEFVVGEEDVLTLAFTSGTTGLPKGVMQSQRMIKVTASTGMIEYRFQRDEFRYSASPLYHVAGFGLIVKCVVRGMTSLILPQWDPVKALDWIRGGLTGVFLVPTMINSLLQVPGVKRSDFATLRSVFYGAAPMSPNLLTRAMEMMDCTFYNGFGAGTEAGGQTVLTPEDHVRAMNGATHLLGSIGRPIYGVDLQIWDDDNNEVKRGDVGEIVTRSDMVMSGYLGQPEMTSNAVVNGWFRGGDLAWQDEEGYLYLAGRKNDMIIRGGENIYPIEIETVLADHPSIAECSVIGARDEHWGEIVRAYVNLRPGTTLDEDELRAFCRERLASYKVPAEIRVVGELPKNASGKILKRELRTWA